jgi:hypothetical protein
VMEGFTPRLVGVGYPHVRREEQPVTHAYGLSRDRTGPLRPSAVSRRVDRSIETPQFDGTCDLKICLRRFQTLTEYYGWNGQVKPFRLRNCIQGDAQYVLLDLDYL